MIYWNRKMVDEHIHSANVQILNILNMLFLFSEKKNFIIFFFSFFNLQRILDNTLL
jgi:hypothetical protein